MEGFYLRKANRKSQKLFPFVKMAEKHGGVYIHLKVLTTSLFVLFLYFPHGSHDYQQDVLMHRSAEPDQSDYYFLIAFQTVVRQWSSLYSYHLTWCQKKEDTFAAVCSGWWGKLWVELVHHKDHTLRHHISGLKTM